MSLNPVLNDNQDSIGRIKELSFQPSVFGRSSDRIPSFDRSASFMDISRQTTENELSITARPNDTLMNRLSPSMNKRLDAVKLT